MTRLAIFSASKPFTDPHINLIQRNAISSWKHLGETVEVWLVGEEEGVAEAANELGVNYIPEVERNEYGTPRVDSIFNLVKQNCQADNLCYVNTDILLFRDILWTLDKVSGMSSRFLLVGQRWDFYIDTPLKFEDGWEALFLSTVQAKAKLHAPAGSDYFVFPRALFTRIPPFAVGRAGWDNWMIFSARQQKLDVINATGSITAVHQNHDFSHLPKGKIHRRQPESLTNLSLAGGRERMFTLYDTNKAIETGMIVNHQLSLHRFLREISIFPLLKIQNPWLAKALYTILSPGQARRDRKKDQKMKNHIENTLKESE